MAPRLLLASILIIAAAGFSRADRGHDNPSGAYPGGGEGLRPLAELSAGPLIGIDRPLRGCSLGIGLGFELEPFELMVRADTAYDFSLDSGALGLDAVIGLGSSLRAIVGGLIPFGQLSLPDPAGLGARVAVKAAPWPDRFGLGATIAGFPLKALRARLGIDAELVYTSYRLEAASALSGAAAFAASVEARLALRLSWGTP